jgi:hypothetical protein
LQYFFKSNWSVSGLNAIYLLPVACFDMGKRTLSILFLLTASPLKGQDIVHER